MGVFDFDTFTDGNRNGQVKIFNLKTIKSSMLHQFRVFKIGDKVPFLFDFDDRQTFSIAMREGGFVNIQEGRFLSWTEEPLSKDVFDKWGARYSKVF